LRFGPQPKEPQRPSALKESQAARPPRDPQIFSAALTKK